MDKLQLVLLLLAFGQLSVVEGQQEEDVLELFSTLLGDRERGIAGGGFGNEISSTQPVPGFGGVQRLGPRAPGQGAGDGTSLGDAGNGISRFLQLVTSSPATSTTGCPCLTTDGGAPCDCPSTACSPSCGRGCKCVLNSQGTHSCSCGTALCDLDCGPGCDCALDDDQLPKCSCRIPICDLQCPLGCECVSGSDAIPTCDCTKRPCQMSCGAGCDCVQDAQGSPRCQCPEPICDPECLPGCSCALNENEVPTCECNEPTCQPECLESCECVLGVNGDPDCECPEPECDPQCVDPCECTVDANGEPECNCPDPEASCEPSCAEDCICTMDTSGVPTCDCADEPDDAPSCDDQCPDGCTCFLTAAKQVLCQCPQPQPTCSIACNLGCVCIPTVGGGICSCSVIPTPAPPLPPPPPPTPTALLPTPPVLLPTPPVLPRLPPLPPPPQNFNGVVATACLGSTAQQLCEAAVTAQELQNRVLDADIEGIAEVLIQSKSVLGLSVGISTPPNFNYLRNFRARNQDPDVVVIKGLASAVLNGTLGIGSPIGLGETAVHPQIYDVHRKNRDALLNKLIDAILVAVHPPGEPTKDCKLSIRPVYNGTNINIKQFVDCTAERLPNMLMVDRRRLKSSLEDRKMMMEIFSADAAEQAGLSSSSRQLQCSSCVNADSYICAYCWEPQFCSQFYWCPEVEPQQQESEGANSGQ